MSSADDDETAAAPWSVTRVATVTASVAEL